MKNLLDLGWVLRLTREQYAYKKYKDITVPVTISRQVEALAWVLVSEINRVLKDEVL